MTYVISASWGRSYETNSNSNSNSPGLPGWVPSQQNLSSWSRRCAVYSVNYKYQAKGTSLNRQLYSGPRFNASSERQAHGAETRKIVPPGLILIMDLKLRFPSNKHGSVYRVSPLERKKNCRYISPIGQAKIHITGLGRTNCEPKERVFESAM